MKRLSKVFVLLALLVSTIGLLVTGCGAQPAPVRLGMLPIIDNLPFWVAQEKGYFKDEGVEVELVAFPSAVERDSAVAGGKIDGALGDLLAVALLNQGGTAVRAVAVGQGVKPEEGRFAILAAPNSGLTSVAQLKNVEIAISPNSIIEYVTDRLLQKEGFKPEEIKKTSIPKIPLRLEALLNGTVKAATLPDPFAAMAESKGARLLLDDTRENLSQTVIFFRQDTLDKNLAGAQKVMKAYARAVSDLQKNPAGYNDLLVAKAGVPKELLTAGNHGMKIVFSAPVLPGRGAVEDVVNWMLERKLLSQKPTFEQLVDKRVLGQ